MRGEFHMSEFEDKLRSIPGLSPFIDSGFIKVGDTMTTLPDQLTVDQLGFLPDIDTLGKEDLEKLLGLLDDLMDDLEDEEPDEETEAHEEWEESMDEVTDLMDEAQSRIEDLEDA